MTLLTQTAPNLARLLAMAVVANLFVMGLAGVFVFQSHQQQLAQARITTQNLAAVLESDLVNAIRRVDVSLQALIDIHQDFHLAGRMSHDFNLHIERVKSRIPEALGLRTTDAAGMLRYGSGVDPAARLSLADRPHFQRLRDDPMAGLVISKPQMSRVDKKWVIVLARRINLPDGRFGGMIFATVSLDFFTQVFANMDLGPRGSVFLRDANMGLIARHPTGPMTEKHIGQVFVSPELQALLRTGQTQGTFFTAATPDGVKRTVSFRKLVEYPGASASLPSGTPLATSTPFEGGDGGDVEIVGGHTYVTEYNGNRIAVFKGIPSATAKADFYLGSPGINPAKTTEAINTLKTNYFITNPQVATLGGAMAINSDFDRAIYVWKKIPATDGAKPDLVWTTQNQNASNPLLAFDFQPDSSAATIASDGKALYAVAGEKTFVVWRGIPTSTSDVPVLNVKDSIGNVTFGGALRVAADNKYFYLLDGEKKTIYVWQGLPSDKNDSPDFTMSAEINRLRSDGTWLIGTSLYRAPNILAWSVSSLSLNAVPTGTVGYRMNLPQDALVANGVLYVADTSYHRILAWNSISAALAGASPDAFLGATSSSDVTPAHSATDVRWPASLWVANGYLWVGERKFGHRILRYALS